MVVKVALRSSKITTHLLFSHYPTVSASTEEFDLRRGGWLECSPESEEQKSSFLHKQPTELCAKHSPSPLLMFSGMITVVLYLMACMGHLPYTLLHLQMLFSVFCLVSVNGLAKLQS